MSDIVKRLRQVPALTTGFVVEIEYELDKVAMDAADEIERLRAERDTLALDLTVAKHSHDQCHEELLKAESERDALRKDAERYRWLRDYYLPLYAIERAHELPNGGYVLHSIAARGPVIAWHQDSKDAAIDAVLREKP